jgi:hypothetical protein
MKIWYFTLALAFLGVLGTVFIAKKKKIGWILWEIECLGFLLVNANRGDWGEVSLWFFYSCFNVYAFMQWK